MIYFAQPTFGGPIRIGCSENVAFRANQLGSWIVGGVEIVATMEGGFFRECVLHQVFGPILIEKDWFRSCRVMWQYMFDVLDGRGDDWLPRLDEHPRASDEAVVAQFGSFESAAAALGYSSAVNVRQAARSSSSHSYSLSARMWFHSALVSDRLPPYLAKLHHGGAEIGKVKAA